MPMSDQDKLERARSGITRCERRIKRTVTMLRKYRRQENYYTRKLAAEVSKEMKPKKPAKVNRKINLE